MPKNISLPKRRTKPELDEAKLRSFEAAAEVAGGGQPLPEPPAPASRPAPARSTTPHLSVPPLSAPSATAGDRAEADEDETQIPAGFAELMDAPRGVARGRGTIADPRVRVVDGRTVRASTIHLPLDLYDQVDQIARATGRSRSAVIEWSLQKLLET